MINLISSEDKKQYLAARRNVVLRKYLVSSLLVVMAVFIVYVVGFYMIYSSKKVADSKLEKATTELRKYDKSKNEAEQYRKDIEVAKYVTSSNFEFNNFLTKLAQVTPSNVIVEKLTIDVSSTTSGKTPGQYNISIRGKSYDDILRTKESYEKSDQFSNVSITRASTQEDSSKATGSKRDYPYEADLTITIEALKGGSK